MGFWLHGNKGKFPKPDIELVGDHTPKAAAIIKQGAGSSSQSIALGDSIVPFTFAIENADAASVEGLPAGVTAKWNSTAKSYYFSGTPTIAGEFVYTITTKGGNSEFGEATRNGKIVVKGSEVPGDTAKDSTQQSAADSLNKEIVNPADSSKTDSTLALRDEWSAEDDFAWNTRIANGVYLNFVDGTLVAREAGFVQIDFFNVMGHRVASFAKNVPAGSSDLGNQINRLTEGAYIVRVKFNGRMVQRSVQVNLKR